MRMKARDEDIEKVQNYPTVDSIPVEPFESLVEMYFQLKGYITSSNKWFWIKELGKKQRGYQDIDVLAVNERETVIISVTTNLDDKVRFTREGLINEKQLKNISKYFERVERFLMEVNEYRWLVENRNVRKILAYGYGGYKNKNKKEILMSELTKMGIELISSDEIIGYIKNRIEDIQSQGLKTNNQVVKMIELLRKIEI